MLEAVQGAYQPVTLKQLSDLKKLTNQVRVAHGKRKTVKIGLKQTAALWLPKGSKINQFSGQLTLAKGKRTIGKHKLRAPLKKGETVGQIKMTPITGQPSLQLPVVSQQNVTKKSLMN